MRLYATAIAIASLAATTTRAPLAWDGSYVLFRMLDTQAPYLSQQRLSDGIIQAPALWAERFVTDVGVLASIFSAAYVVFPAIALGVSWWALRRTAPQLFFWPALGIGLVALPGIFCFVSEAMIAVELAWAVLALLVVELTGARIVALIALVAFLFPLHPASVPLFLVAAAVCVSGIARRGQSAAAVWLRVGIALGLVCLAVLRPQVLPLDAYERQTLSVDAMRAAWLGAVAGQPIVAFALTVVTASFAYCAARSRLRGDVTTARVLTALATGAVLGVALDLIIWASDPSAWPGAIGYRLWLPVLSLPFMLGLAAESIGPASVSAPANPARRSWPDRLPIVQASGVTLCLVLIVQSAVWQRMTDQLAAQLKRADGACLSSSSVSLDRGTILADWELASYALVLQGRAPHTLVQAGSACVESDISRVVHVAPWDVRDRSTGWFQLQQTGLDSVSNNAMQEGMQHPAP